jgi:threonine dehydratase
VAHVAQVNVRFVAAGLGTTRDVPDADAIDRAEAACARAGLRAVSLLRATELDVRADASAGTRVWLALEQLQRTGSFKVRGAVSAVAERVRRGGPGLHVVAASAGNHGAGVAYAGRLLGVPTTVVVPAHAPQAKRARIAASGAELVVCGHGGYDEAEAYARAIASERGAAFLSPYDDVDVIAGNGGALGREIARALGREPDAVLAPIGGGGLATGLACAMRAARVFGVQSEASCAMALSLERGAAVERLEPHGDTLADGLEGGIAAAAFERARAVVAGVFVVKERDVARAMAWLEDELGLVVEGSAATALAPVLAGRAEPTCGGDLVVVLTGRNVDGKTRARARALASARPRG